MTPPRSDAWNRTSAMQAQQSRPVRPAPFAGAYLPAFQSLRETRPGSGLRLPQQAPRGDFGRSIGLLKLRAPVAQGIERNGHAAHRANDMIPSRKLAERTGQILQAGQTAGGRHQHPPCLGASGPFCNRRARPERPSQSSLGWLSTARRPRGRAGEADEAGASPVLTSSVPSANFSVSTGCAAALARSLTTCPAPSVTST